MPNMLSMFRLVLIIPVTWLILQDGPLFWMMILILLAVATDYFDGRIARWSDSVSDWGKLLDPLADKVGGAMVIAALTFRESEPSLPFWFIAVMIVRDLVILGGGAILRTKTGKIVMSLWSGKVAVTAVAITALAALLKADTPILEFCIWASVVLLAYSFVRYMARFFFHSQRRSRCIGSRCIGSCRPQNGFLVPRMTAV